MLLHRPWLHSLEGFCCALSSLFPKVFCTFILSWSLYALVSEACYNNLYATQHYPIAALIIGMIGLLTYSLCIYTYFKIILVGAGSPRDFAELKIKNMRSLSANEDASSVHSKGRSVSANPYDSILDHSSFSTTATTSTSLLSQVEELGGADDSASTTAASEQYPEQPPSSYMKVHTLKNNSSSYRYCIKCSVWKPDRCHHCSTCNTCVLRMDHHCPWFATCVGFHNQKFFIQFLLYATFHSFFAGLTSFCLLYQFFANEEYSDAYLSLKLVFLFILGVTFFIAVGVFALFSIYLILKNTTTIEFQENRWNIKNKKGGSFKYEFDNHGKKKQLGNIFTLGTKRNWESVMGDSWKVWLLPIQITSFAIDDEYNNGLNFEINQDIYDKYCDNAHLQDQLNQQLAEYRKRLMAQRETHSVDNQV